MKYYVSMQNQSPALPYLFEFLKQQSNALYTNWTSLNICIVYLSWWPLCLVMFSYVELYLVKFDRDPTFYYKCKLLILGPSARLPVPFRCPYQQYLGNKTCIQVYNLTVHNIAPIGTNKTVVIVVYSCSTIQHFFCFCRCSVLFSFFSLLNIFSVFMLG